MKSAKQEILGRLKTAQDKRGEVELKKPDFTSPIYHPLNSDLLAEFQEKLELVSGNVIIANDLDELISEFNKLKLANNWDSVFCLDEQLNKIIDNKIEINSDRNQLLKMKVGISKCESLIAHLGSILLSSVNQSGRKMNVFPEIHVIFAYEDQIVDYLDTAFKQLQDKYHGNLSSLTTVVTGPSRTADIEKTLVMGMHGPKSLFVFISKKPF